MNRGLVNIKWCKTVIIRLAQFEPGSGKNLDKTDGAKLAGGKVGRINGGDATVH